ncbi:mannose-6-phosphate isomerase, class I [Corynebacterium mayonis]|uniref:mannose-6-phosphate isomerase, class I n=1 Tax=Corynebacterium mayonis TaxID=3062461 RepID=UPI0031402C89
MERLEPSLKSYPWGSRSLFANLRGLPAPAPKPEAELWFGAHTAAPSTVKGRNLDDIIASDPQAALGARVAKDFGAALPFLLKLLAAGEPLSIQAHPSKLQAEEGYARENSLGIDLASPERNYRDANHKPELMVALTEFHALAGFRPCERIRELFDALACPALERYQSLISPEGDEESLRALFTTWIALPPNTRTELILELSECALTLADDPTWLGQTARNFLALAEQYPHDSGTLVSLLLNHVVMQPGEAIFLAAGQLHAYLRGLGVEIMANSDNVLRGGLTTKHVDVPELLRILRFKALDSAYVDVSHDGPETIYAVACEDFRLSRFDMEAGQFLNITHDGPAIILATEGESCVSDATTKLDITPGQAVWVPAGDALSIKAAGEGSQFFLARA